MFCIHLHTTVPVAICVSLTASPLSLTVNLPLSVFCVYLSRFCVYILYLPTQHSDSVTVLPLTLQRTRPFCVDVYMLTLYIYRHSSPTGSVYSMDGPTTRSRSKLTSQFTTSTTSANFGPIRSADVPRK